jgi:putative inorganic carbon (HCO3(-)) transporter
MLKDYWVTGFGLGNEIFRRLVQTYPLHSKMIPAHSHNLFLQIWLEAGITGFVSIMCYMAGLFKRAVKAVVRPKDIYLGNTILAGLCGFIAICVAGLADHIWFNPRVMLLFWSVAGIITASLIMLRSEHRQETDI